MFEYKDILGTICLPRRLHSHASGLRMDFEKAKKELFGSCLHGGNWRGSLLRGLLVEALVHLMQLHLQQALFNLISTVSYLSDVHHTNKIAVSKL